MPVRIRLQRHGKKGKPFYWIVAADSRAKRDGKFLEKLGTYNPVTRPADIKIDIDAAVKWLMNGAQPTETARAILKYTGVLYKKHLLTGVRKGAFDEAEAERRFNEWYEKRMAKIQAHKERVAAEEKAKKEAILEREKAYSDKRAAAQSTEEEVSEEPLNKETPVEETAPSEENTAEATPAEETPAEETNEPSSDEGEEASEKSE